MVRDLWMCWAQPVLLYVYAPHGRGQECGGGQRGAQDDQRYHAAPGIGELKQTLEGHVAAAAVGGRQGVGGGEEGRGARYEVGEEEGQGEAAVGAVCGIADVQLALGTVDSSTYRHAETHINKHTNFTWSGTSAPLTRPAPPSPAPPARAGPRPTARTARARSRLGVTKGMVGLASDRACSILFCSIL